MARSSGREVIGVSRGLAARALAAAALLAPALASADINPWMASSVFDPERWDSGGKFAATSWIHPPPYDPHMGWGMLDPETAFRTGDWKKMSGFTGSWGHAQDRLREAGLGFSLAYFGQLAANPVGGEVEGGASFRGDMAGSVFVDLERVAGWYRTFFTATADWKAGNPTLSQNYVGNQFSVQLDSFDDPSAIRLADLAVSKQLFDNSLELILGRLITAEDFGELRLACTSLNQAICGTPIVANQNIDFPTFPNAVWGGVLRVKPGNTWVASAGSYLVYPDFTDRTAHGVDFSAPDGSGALTTVQFTYLTGKSAGTSGLRGCYLAGGYYSSERLPRFKDSTQEEVRGFYGFYALGEQLVWTPDPEQRRGVTLWGALSWAPPDRNKLQFMAAGGALWQGIFAGRSQDGIALLAAYGSWSDRIPDTTGELIIEANYRFTLAPWFWIEPDVQGIVNPSGSSAIPDALVVGLGVGFVL